MPRTGRPCRHLYRRSADGLARARALPDPRRGRQAGGGDVTRALVALLMLAGRALPADRREWVEALASEAGSVPPGAHRVGWLLGSLPLITRELVMTRAAIRTVVAGLVLAVGVLTTLVIDRYPEVASGRGTPLYTTLLGVVLAGYVLATVLLTRRYAVGAGYGLVAGLATAVLWTVGLPAGGAYHPGSPWLGALYGLGLVLVFTVPAVLAGLRSVRRTTMVEQGVLAGAATGAVAALTNLVGGLVLVLVLPERVPADSDVLATHHTPDAILGANVGEDLVLFILLLVVWPVVGTALGTLGGAVAGMRRATA